MSDFMAFFEANIAPKLTSRAPTFRHVLCRALDRGVKTIVETGCIRKEDNWKGDGQSTLIWNAYCKSEKGYLTSIDLDEEAIALVKQKCPNVRTICADSVNAISQYPGNNDWPAGIDLLYLDSFDLDIANSHGAALHCFNEFCAAQKQLRPGAIVFIDDSPMGDDGIVCGKGSYVGQYMRKLGIAPFTSGYQAAWLMPL